MRLTERKGSSAPQHLVVFITSDEDFSEKIAELQSRNFMVVVLYHNPEASKKPVSILHAADESYDWLLFLRAHLNMTNLTLQYDPNMYHPVTRFNRAHAAVAPCPLPPAVAFRPQAAPYQPNAASQPAVPAAPWHQAQASAASQQHSRSTAQWDAPSLLPGAVAAAAQPSGSVGQVARHKADKQATSVVAIHGLTKGKLPVSRVCSLIVARVLGQQVADSITVTVIAGWDGPVAMLDFGAMPNSAQQAAGAAVALNGEHFNDAAIRAELLGSKAETVPPCSSALSVPKAGLGQASVAPATPSRAASWAASKAEASRIAVTAASSVAIRSGKEASETPGGIKEQNGCRFQAVWSDEFMLCC